MKHLIICFFLNVNPVKNCLPFQNTGSVNQVTTAGAYKLKHFIRKAPYSHEFINKSSS